MKINSYGIMCPLFQRLKFCIHLNCADNQLNIYIFFKEHSVALQKQRAALLELHIQNCLPISSDGQMKFREP